MNLFRVTALLVATLIGLVGGCAWTSAGALDASEVTRAADLDEVPPTTVKGLDVDRMMGTWYVVATNYDFWAGRANVTITYEPIDGPAGVAPDLVKISDEVAYTDGFGRDATPGQILGVDLQDPTLAGHFQWRGEGLLNLIESHWFVVAVDPDYEWLVTYFADSNFGTGAGMDIYARRPCPSVGQEAAAIRAIYADAWLAARADGLFRVAHEGGGPCRHELGPRVTDDEGE